MRYWHPVRSALVAGLCFSMAMSGTACQKKTKNAGAEVLDSDPYFDADVYELEIPLDDTKQLNWLMINSVDYLGEEVMVQYDAGYEVPKGVEGAATADYYQSGTALFDLKGNLIGNSRTGLSTNEVPRYSARDSEGNVTSLINFYDTETRSQYFKIVVKNEAGEELRQVKLEIPSSVQVTNFEKMTVLPDGRFVLSTYGRSGSVFQVFDGTGKYLFEISSVDRSIEGDLFRQDGKYYVLTSSKSDGMNYQVNEIDITNGTLKKGRALAGSYIDTASVTSGEEGLYCATSNGISKLNLNNGEMEEFLNWNQTDINQRILGAVKSYPQNDDHIIVVASEFLGGNISRKVRVIHLDRAEKNPHAGKKILSVGGLALPSAFHDYVSQYNADPDHPARIVVEDYMDIIEFSEDQSWANMTNTIYLDVLSGEGPDILMNFSGSEQFASEDLLVDLNTYIDGKGGLDRGEYFDNIFRALETDGKLYFMPLSFTLSGYLLNTEILDVDRNWTMDGLDTAAGKLPEDTTLFPESTPYNLFCSFMGNDLTKYLDTQKKETHFCCDDMVRVLETAKKYGIENPFYYPSTQARISLLADELAGIPMYSPSGHEGQPALENMFYAGKYAAMPFSISDITEYFYAMGLAGGKGKMIGDPSIQGEGIVANAGMSMAIVRSSKYQDECWDIIKGFLSDDAQRLISTRDGLESPGSFPVRRSTFETTGKEQIEDYRKACEKWKEFNIEYSGLYDYIVFPVREDAVNEVRELIESVRFSYHMDVSLYGILEEETAGYFFGTRTPEEVLRTVDNRARQIISER